MFLVRSAFWLTLAFLVMKPGFDVQGTTQALTDSAMQAGQAIVAGQVLDSHCATLQCASGKALLSVALSSSQAKSSSQAEPASRNDAAGDAVPLPRPRPKRAG
jgi:hypothetical protein